MGGACEQELLVRRVEGAKPVLCAYEVSLGGVAVPTRAGIGRDLDLGKLGLALLDRFFLVVGVDEDVEIRRAMLSLEREHVVAVRVDLEVGIGDRFLPELFPLGRQRLRLPFLLMSRRIDLQQKPEQVDDAAGIFVAEPARIAVFTSRTDRKYRL